MKKIAYFFLYAACAWGLWFTVALLSTNFHWIGITKDMHLPMHIMGFLALYFIGELFINLTKVPKNQHQVRIQNKLISGAIGGIVLCTLSFIFLLSL